jgi:hypothetical protein
MRRGFKIATAAAALSTLGLAPALGVIEQPPEPASGASPFGNGECNTQPQSGALYRNSEVEPWLDVDPTSADDADGPDFIGVYQQDRYETGGARGLGTSLSTNGAASFDILSKTELPNFTQCIGSVGQLWPQRRRVPDIALLQRHRESRQRDSREQVVRPQRRSAVERPSDSEAGHKPCGFQ